MKLTVFHANQVVRAVRDSHQQVARIVQAVERRPDVTCKPGCSHCCKILNLVAFGEAVTIADGLFERLPTAEFSALMDRLDRYITQHLPEPTYALDRQAHFDKQVSCTMLGDDNLCTIYADRPSACRLHYAVSDPDKCARAPDGKPQMVKYLDLDAYKGNLLAVVGTMQPAVPWAIAPLEIVLWWAMLHRRDGALAFGVTHDGPLYRNRNLDRWSKWALALRTPMTRLDSAGRVIGESVGTAGITS